MRDVQYKISFRLYVFSLIQFYCKKVSDSLKLHVYERKLPQHTCKICAMLLLMIELAINTCAIGF